MSVGDFKDGLKDFNDYINGTKVDIRNWQVDVDVNDGTNCTNSSIQFKRNYL